MTTAIMSVQGTGAMAASSPTSSGLTGPGSAGALATLAVLTGLLMLAAGLAGLGTLVRYVPNAVLTGFVNAVALNIVIGQLAGATGYASAASNCRLRRVDIAGQRRVLPLADGGRAWPPW
ncbi:MAG: SulP family inorganic anion transporter [Propionicimonas sp.]